MTELILIWRTRPPCDLRKVIHLAVLYGDWGVLFIVGCADDHRISRMHRDRIVIVVLLLILKIAWVKFMRHSSWSSRCFVLRAGVKGGPWGPDHIWICVLAWIWDGWVSLLVLHLVPIFNLLAICGHGAHSMALSHTIVRLWLLELLGHVGWQMIRHSIRRLYH